LFAASPVCSAVGHGNLASFGSVVTSWTQYQYNFTANKTAQTLMFGFMAEPNGQRVIFLDNVSIVDVIAPSIQLLQNPSFDNSSATLTGWTQYCTSSCTQTGAFGGKVASGSNCSSTNCYADYCYGTGIDFLSQTFPTTIGHVYELSFWIIDWGITGPNMATKLYIDIY
jgi:hypothetical protein